MNPDPANYRAVSLHQPWATFIALGVKTIETRGRGTSWRGPLLIHAAKREPDVGLEVGPWVVERGVASGRHHYWIRERRSTGSADDGRGRCVPLALGAMVALAELTDVAPMIYEHSPVRYPYVSVRDRLLVTAANDGADLAREWPYGDYRTGRDAWLLADAQALERPVTEYPCGTCRPDWRGLSSLSSPITRCPECQGLQMVPVKGSQAAPWRPAANLVAECLAALG